MLITPTRIPRIATSKFSITLCTSFTFDTWFKVAHFPSEWQHYQSVLLEGHLTYLP